MAGVAGFDTSEFPGLPQMRWLKNNTNLAWCGYYLGPAPNHGNTGWMGQRAALADEGWGLAPLYVGQQLNRRGLHNITGPQGITDGRDAVGLLSHEGFRPGTCVYLDLEDGPPLESRSEYVAAWVDTVIAGGFQAGVYCSYLIASDVHVLRDKVRVWAFHVQTTAEHPFPGTNFPDSHPAGSGYSGASIWQLAQSCRLTLSGAPSTFMLVDLDSAITPDPAAP
jgi:hypothetical protein